MMPEKEDVYRLNNVRVANVPVEQIDKIFVFDNTEHAMDAIRFIQNYNKEKDKAKGANVCYSYDAANMLVSDICKKHNYETSCSVVCVWESGYTVTGIVSLTENEQNKNNAIQNRLARSMMSSCGYLDPKEKSEEQLLAERKWVKNDIPELRKNLSRLSGIREEYERCIREYGKIYAVVAEHGNNGKSKVVSMS